MSPAHPLCPARGSRRSIRPDRIAAGHGQLALAPVPAQVRPKAGDRLCVDDTEGTLNLTVLPDAPHAQRRAARLQAGRPRSFNR